MRGAWIRRFGWALAMGLLSCGGGTGPTAPSTPSPLGRDQLVFDSDRSGNREIFTMGSDGSQVRQITSDGNHESWWPRLSPDRTRLLFYRTPRGSAERYDLASLWIVNTDGTGLLQLRAPGTDGWEVQGHGEWSPDGRAIAMFGGPASNPQIYVTDAMGRAPRRVTDRAGVNTDVSWSPDGRTLLFNGCPGSSCAEKDYEIYAVPASGGTPTRLTFDALPDYDPYFSPDGRSIAWLTKSDPAAWGGIGAWGIRMAAADGSGPSWLIDDGNINSRPAWSLDGQAIYFHRMEPARETRWGVFHIRRDGTGLLSLTASAPGNNVYPSN